MSLFNDSKLFISARSPFARRVRIAFFEHDIKYEEIVFNVFERNPLLEKHNPLRRVPTLVLQSGQEIVDSQSILNVFYEEKRNSHLIPFMQSQKVQMYHWSGIALGLCEKIIENYLESLRPKHKQDDVVFFEVREIVFDTLFKLENFLVHKTYLVNESFTQADIDLGVALAYLQLRMPLSWEQKFPRVFEYLARLDERPGFRATKPPTT